MKMSAAATKGMRLNYGDLINGKITSLIRTRRRRLVTFSQA